MSETLTTTEMNCATGEVTQRPLTAEEIVSYNAMVAESETRKAEAEAAAIALAAAKQSAYEKLAALGLTTEEIAAL